MTTIRYILVFLFLLLAKGSYSQLVINEVCTKNNTVLQSVLGDYYDWIELYNNSASPMNLEGMYLTDNDQMDKWTFPQIVIEPNDYLILYASNNDTSCYNEIHTNFKLSSQGERIIFLDHDLNIVDSLTIPALTGDISYGLVSGSTTEYSFFNEPTPGAINNSTPCHSFHPSPSINPDSRFSSEAMWLKINRLYPNTNIKYGFNGNMEFNSMTEYVDSILISQTTVVHAIAWSDSLLPSDVSTSTFFIGFTTSLPVISISTEPDNLWSEDHGIYIAGPNADSLYPHYGANYWQDWTIPISMEYFDGNGELGFAGNFGMEIHGGTASRTKAMKPLRIIADEKYGTAEINYPIFRDKNITTFKRLILRNSGSDFNRKHFTDGFIHRVLIRDSVNIDLLAYEPAIVFLNGEYWGIQNIREKADKYYMQNNHGAEPDNIDLLEEESLIVEGDLIRFEALESFILNSDLSHEVNFDYVSENLDIESFCDYFIAETFFNNFDWPYNNLKYWCEKKSGGKWRYMMFDLDVSLNNYGWATHHHDCLGRILSEYGDENRHVTIFEALMQNTEFRNYFINRYADLINTTLSAGNLNTQLAELVEYLTPEMPAHFNKWGSNIDTWLNTNVSEAADFVTLRPDYAKQFIMEAFDLHSQWLVELKTIPDNAGSININSLKPEDFPWTGYYFNSVPIVVTALDNEGFFFDHWEDSYHNVLSFDARISHDLVENTELHAVFLQDSELGQYTIFPEPANEMTYFKYISLVPETANIQIIDVQGKLASIIKNLSISHGVNYVAIKTDLLQSGFYVLKFSSASVAISGRLVIQH